MNKHVGFFSRRHWVIWKALVRTDYKLRYQGSFLGHFWDFIKPLMLFSVRFMVFSRFLGFGKGVQNFPLALFLATMLWTFFQEGTSQAMTAIMSRREMIKKAKVPSLAIILSSLTGSLLNLGNNFLVLILFFLGSGLSLSIKNLFFLPLLLELLLLTTGLALFLSVAYAYFRDMSSLWTIFLQVTMYTVPIIYPMSRIVAYNEQVAGFLMLNPMAQMIQDARYVLLGSETQTAAQLIQHPFLVPVPYLIPPLCFVGGLFLFKTYSKKFPEIL